MEASWTPAASSQEEDGPLPLSNRQHQQLLQLDRHISSSSNPDETLKQIAASSNMSELELKKLLERNRALASLTGTTTRRLHPVSVLSQVLSSLVVFILHFAKIYPKRFSMCIFVLVSIFYVTYNIPRNGVVVSRGAVFPISHGFTTLWKPPRQYISSFLSSTLMHQRSRDILKTKHHHSESQPTAVFLLSKQFATDTMPWNQVTIMKKKHHHNRPMKDNQKMNCYSVTARTTVPIPQDLILQLLVLLQDTNSMAPEKKDDSMLVVNPWMIPQPEHRAEIEALKLTTQAALSVLALRRFVEYVQVKNGNVDISFQTLSTSTLEEQGHDHLGDYDGGSPPTEEVAALVVKTMGDYRRYGIQPLRLSYYQDNTKQQHYNNIITNGTCDDQEPVIVIGYSTLHGGHWDGELRIAIDIAPKYNASSIKKKKTKGKTTLPISSTTGAAVIVSVSIIIPQKEGRKLPSSDALSSKIVTALADSISHSIAVETQRRAAQNIHRKRFARQTHTLAMDKRKVRNESIKKLEEMERDRRRRRYNRDGGRYRPTGPRLPQQTKFS